MKFLYRSLALMFFVFFALAARAQNPSDSTKTTPKSYFQVSMDLLTNAIYNGRKDSVANPYLTTSFGYYHKNGLYLTGSASYQPNNQLFDMFAIDAGYNWNISDQFSASFNADKPFYNKASTSVASGIKGSLDAGLTYDTDFITTDASVSSVFSKKADILVTGTLSHLFQLNGFGANAFWSMKPGFGINLGTQNFFHDYKTRSTKKKLISATSTMASGKNTFQVLDYEFSLPVAYNSRKWELTFSPIYAIPVNPITSTTTVTVKTPGKTRTLVTTDTEKLKQVFYAEITFDLKFR